MKTFRRAIGIAILLPGIPLVHSYPSAGKIETYVSKSSSINLRQDELSRFFFAQQIEDSMKVHTLDSSLSFTKG